MTVALAAFLLASLSDPGTVTADNWQRIEAQFPYDAALYTPKQCSTCRIPR